MELKRCWEILWRRKWILIEVIVFMPLCAYILMSIISPIYQSKAKLWIKASTLQQKFISNIPAEFGRFDFLEAKNAMATIEEILKSDAVIGKVIDEMGIKDKDGEFFRRKDFANPNLLKLLSKKKGVKIELVTDSEAFNIIGYSRKTSEAQEIAEKVIENFLSAISMMYKEEVKKAMKIITERMSDVQDRLVDAEQTVTVYKTKNRLYNVENQITTLISSASSLESELYNTERTVKAAQGRIKAIKETLAKQPEYKETQTTIERNPLIEEYKKQLLSLELTLAKLLTERTTEHPDVKTQMSQIAVVKAKITNEIEKTFSSQNINRNSYYDELISTYYNTEIDDIKNIAIQKIASRQISKINSKLKILTMKERELTHLSKEMDNLRTTYTSLFSNLETAKSALSTDLTNTVVIQPAVILKNLKENLRFPPERKLPRLVLATIVGTVLGLFLVFLFEYLDDRIWNSQEVENALNYKVICTVPKINKKDLNIEKIESSPLTDSIYNLLANMKLFKGDGVGKVVSILSSIKGEGKSTLAVFISSLLAQQGMKVILVDGNLRDPSLHNIFNLPHNSGISNFFLSNGKIQEIRHPTFLSNLDVITAGTAPIANPQKYLDSDRFSGLVKTLMTDYDTVMLDTPAFVNGSDALMISKCAQDSIFVVEQGKTTEQRAKEFMVAIERANIKVTGAVLNKVQKGILCNFLSR